MGSIAEGLYNSYPKTPRTYTLRLLGPKTILSKAVRPFCALGLGSEDLGFDVD